MDRGKTQERKRAAVFVSGSGTNMENIARKVQAGKLACEIALVVCDQPGALALKRAEKFGLRTFVVERKQFVSKAVFEARIDRELRANQVDLIFLAGYMRILSPEFVRAWQWKILNIHPSLLPKFPGAHAIRDAFEAREKETGVTIHFVTADVDAGPIILQRRVAINPQDTFETLEARVHETEHELYSEAIQLVLSGKARVTGGCVEIS